MEVGWDPVLVAWRFWIKGGRLDWFFKVVSWFLVGFNSFFKVVSWFFMIFGWFPWCFKVVSWFFMVLGWFSWFFSKTYPPKLYPGPTIQSRSAAHRAAKDLVPINKRLFSKWYVVGSVICFLNTSAACVWRSWGRLLFCPEERRWWLESGCWSSGPGSSSSGCNPCQRVQPAAWASVPDFFGQGQMLMHSWNSSSIREKLKQHWKTCSNRKWHKCEHHLWVLLAVALSESAQQERLCLTNPFWNLLQGSPRWADQSLLLHLWSNPVCNYLLITLITYLSLSKAHLQEVFPVH